MVKQKRKVVEQSKALEYYFDSLLNDTSEAVASELPSVKPTMPPAPKTAHRTTSVADILAPIAEAAVEEKAERAAPDFAEPPAKIKLPLPEVKPATEVKTETKVKAETEVRAETRIKTDTEIKVPETKVVEITETVTETETQQPTAPQQTDSGRPEWVDQPFQCLLFKVGGLSLAVPLTILNGVIPWSDKIVETPNQTDWYLGLLQHHGTKVRIIDTAVMVLPDEHRKELPEDPAERMSHILLVDDQRWGLACDSIGDVVWLSADKVKWRTNRGQRPWLMGTALEHLCALIDTEAFADMLNETDQGNQPSNP